jgi:hypothetical protein
MKVNAGLLGVSTILFATSIAVAHQEGGGKAEQVFKNIQVLKGEKASDIVPAMQFISASLKVDCDYCHMEDRAKDDKKTKATARKMILMTRAINEANFNGRTQVTCATCHAGHPNPIPVPPVQGITDRFHRDDNGSPDKILADYDAAVGGPAATNLKGLHFEGESTADGHKSKLDVIRLGDRFVMGEVDAAHPAEASHFGYNGTQGWFTRGKFSTVIPANVMIGFRHQMAMYSGKASLPALDKMEAGTATIDGKEMVAVRGTSQGDIRATFFFDKQSHLLVRTVFLTPTILGSIPLVCDYSDFHKVDGVQIAMRIGIHSGDGDEDNQLKNVHQDAKLDAAAFDPPKKG